MESSPRLASLQHLFTLRMSAKHYTRVVLNERPFTDITPATFRIESVPFDLHPGQGEILVQVNWLSLDPAMRFWLKDVRSYMPPVQIGEIMRSAGLATVVEVGEGCRLQLGDIMSCFPGMWSSIQISLQDAVLINRLDGVCHLERGRRCDPKTRVSTTDPYTRSAHSLRNIHKRPSRCRVARLFRSFKHFRCVPHYQFLRLSTDQAIRWFNGVLRMWYDLTFHFSTIIVS